MRPADRSPRQDGLGPRRMDGSREDGVGPQGAELILELQRLREAFDQKDWRETNPSQPGASRAGARPAARQQSKRPQMRRGKSKIGRALDVCLEQFGFSAASAPQRGSANVPARGAPAKVAQRSPAKGVPRGPGKGTPGGPARAAVDAAARGAAGAAVGDIKRAKESVSSPRLPGAPPRAPGIVKLDPISMAKPNLGMELPGAEHHEVRLHGSELRGAARLHRPSAPIATPQLRLPPRQPQPPTTVGRLIDKGRSGVASGFAFLVERDAPAHNDNLPGESMTVRARRSYERELRTGLRVLLVAVLLGGGWLGLMPLAGAVVVPGNLVVQSNVKTIQHPTGGVVAEIPVHNGMRVNAGDLLVRLDATQAKASLQVVSKQLDELHAKMPRLVAERDGLERPEFPAELTARSGDDAIKGVLASEQSLFKARSSARQSQKDLLQSRVSQLGEEISGLEAQVDSKAKQLELIGGELTGVQDLYDKRLVPLTRLTTLQREAARIDGERGQLVSSIAETKAKIGESQLQILRTDQDFRTEVVKELGETQSKEAELTERGIAARDLLDRIEIHAPTSGVIHQLSMHTIGGVVRAGDALMEVVPDSDDLLIEAKLQPNDIDQVRTGQQAFVRFSAFNQRVTPQMSGTVSYIAADISKDQQSAAPYYTVRVSLPEDERHRMAGLQLVSGMPAEVFMQTGKRTMLSYLLKPITDQLDRAFVER